MFGLGSPGRERVGLAAERLAAASGGPASGTVAASPVAPPVRELAFERDWTRQAGQSVRVDVDELIQFAEARAGIAPVRELSERDFTREVLEELADARNYLVWRALQEVRGPSPQGAITSEVGSALQSVAIAFAAMRRVRSWERGG